MKNMQRTLSLMLAVFMLLVLNTAAFAAEDDTGYSDVAATSWYAGAAGRQGCCLIPVYYERITV